MKVDNKNSLISLIQKHERISLRAFIHLFAAKESENWKFEESIPNDNFVFTFHPLYWRYYYDHDKNIQHILNVTNFSQIWQHGNEELSEIYKKCEEGGFLSLSLNEFISCYNIFAKLTDEIDTYKIGLKENSPYINQYIDRSYIPSRFGKLGFGKIKNKEELTNLYEDSLYFFKILKQAEEFLFELREQDIKELKCYANKNLDVLKFCKFPTIYNYHFGIINQVRVNKTDYIEKAYVEFDTKASIKFFEVYGGIEGNITKDLNKKETRNRGRKPKFDEIKVCKIFVESLDVEFDKSNTNYLQQAYEACINSSILTEFSAKKENIVTYLLEKTKGKYGVKTTLDDNFAKPLYNKISKKSPPLKYTKT